MKKKSIKELVADVRRKRRIGKYNVKALRADFFTDGITRHEDADLLIELDREVDSVHFSWPSFFISALTEFVVWNSGQPGYIDEDNRGGCSVLWPARALRTERSVRSLRLQRKANCFDEAFFPTSARSTRDRQEHSSQEFGIAA